MRTTLTIDDDVARAIEELRRSKDMSLKVAVNRLLREGLRNASAPLLAKPYESEPRHLGLRAGLDATKLNQLADEVEAEERGARLSRAEP